MSTKMDTIRQLVNTPFKRLRFQRDWHAEFEWKLADLWIGAFWKRTGNCIDLWVCFIPCVPLHVSWWWSDPKQN